MTPEKFLQDLLVSQNLLDPQEKDLQAHKKEVTDFLRTEFGASPVIKYAGSREKGTMIRDRYDLDIVCYFPSTDNRSLKEIRDDVAKHLAQRYLTRPKASAERILDLKGKSAPVDFHIDVVPGRFIENSKDVFLHVAYGDRERIQTNLKTHIDYIVNSGCVPIIRLAKLWAHRNNLTIKTFVLELFVVEALSGSRNKGNLKEGFREVIEAFRDTFTITQLIDPANTNNIVSQATEESDKVAIEHAASTTFDKIGRSENVADWQGVFNEVPNGSISSGGGSAALASATSTYSAGASFSPSRPFGDYDYGN